jgi:hypothetical protein
VTLALALRRQAVCREVVADVICADGANREPLRVQPVAAPPLRAAADAGGAGEPQVLPAHIKADEREDEVRLRKVLDMDADAQKVRDAFGLYVRGNLTSRIEQEKALAKGKAAVVAAGISVAAGIGVAASTKLERLPSERLAATVVARCLREIEAGREEFLVPLVDMVCSGVVCSDVVLAVMSGLAVPGADGASVSMTHALTRSIDTSYGLEAVLMRVSDLSDADVVRAA